MLLYGSRVAGSPGVWALTDCIRMSVACTVMAGKGKSFPVTVPATRFGWPTPVAGAHGRASIPPALDAYRR
jgi:hypothetical protein